MAVDDSMNERMIKAARIHIAGEARDTLRIVEEKLSDSPDAMRYFYSVLSHVFSGRIPSRAVPTQKNVGTLCIHVPEELIYAAGAVPVRLCSGSHAFEQAGADLLPAKSCPLVKATVGMLQIASLTREQEFSLIVSPSTCEQKKKAGEMLEEFGYSVYHLELPSSKNSEEARIYWRRSVKKFVHVLEKTTGQAITARRLIKAIGTVRSAQIAYRRLHNIMKSPHPVIRGSDAMLVMSAYLYDDLPRWTAAVDKLVGELEERKNNRYKAGSGQAPRILFAGSPPIFPNLKLPLLIELAGGLLVADEVCSSSRLLYDMVAYDEAHCYDLIPSLADRYLKPCTCPVFNSGLDRKRRLMDMAASFAVDGVIYQSFAGCMPFEFEKRGIGKSLSEAGIPVLFIETDYGPDDAGQLATRVEAFLESLKARKRRSA
jgi:benzoyl-CoA reductase/2-hydroxyglutaryl-CoA dehydratase subunit BcrC/BadD/HgdB